jgi:hypothetical protein
MDHGRLQITIQPIPDQQAAHHLGQKKGLARGKALSKSALTFVDQRSQFGSCPILWTGAGISFVRSYIAYGVAGGLPYFRMTRLTSLNGL